MLTDLNVILTGANRGIGAAILCRLAENHANVWCMTRTKDVQFANQVKKLMEDHSVWIKIIIMNLESESSIKSAVRQVIEDGKPIDALVNNAGINHHGTFLMTSRAAMEKVYAVNYFANMQLIQLVAKRMIPRKKGNIINITSASGFENNMGNFAYGASKASMNWATRTISRELAPYNIRVNGIAPGVIHTDINHGNECTIQKTVLPRMNIQREGRVEEIADGVIYLLSEASSFVSGQIIRIDGGRF